MTDITPDTIKRLLTNAPVTEQTKAMRYLLSIIARQAAALNERCAEDIYDDTLDESIKRVIAESAPYVAIANGEGL